MLAHIVGDFSGMPPLMKRLAVAQFFTWSALYTMWVFTTPVVAQYFYGSTDPASTQFQDAGNEVGKLFAVYNGVAAIWALTFLPFLARAIGKARTHMLCLTFGAAGYASFLFLRDVRWLILSEVGVGIAWASVLAMPYAILASSLPQRKLGIYMAVQHLHRCPAVPRRNGDGNDYEVILSRPADLDDAGCSSGHGDRGSVDAASDTGRREWSPGRIMRRTG